MKKISIVTPCYNEEGNVAEVAARVSAVMTALGRFDWEHIFIDNASTDATLGLLRGIAARDHRVKVIVNARNFGPVRSPIHALYRASGDAVALLFADLQDPPELLADMIALWERGNPVIAGIKTRSDESGVMYALRGAYYRLIRKLANMQVYEHFTGFGLYDRTVIDLLRRQFYEPYPYFRGQIADMGFPVLRLEYHQKARQRGTSKNDFYALYDQAMLGITNVSKIPLRMAAFAGFLGAGVSLAVGLFYLFYKLLYWSNFSVGIAPALIGMSFFLSLQMVALGMLGEYVGSIHTMLQNRPLVVERETINFDTASAPGVAPSLAHLALAASDPATAARSRESRLPHPQ